MGLNGGSKVDVVSPQLIIPLEHEYSDWDSDWKEINVEQTEGKD